MYISADPCLQGAPGCETNSVGGTPPYPPEGTGRRWRTSVSVRFRALSVGRGWFCRSPVNWNIAPRTPDNHFSMEINIFAGPSAQWRLRSSKLSFVFRKSYNHRAGRGVRNPKYHAGAPAFLRLVYGRCVADAPWPHVVSFFPASNIDRVLERFLQRLLPKTSKNQPL